MPMLDGTDDNLDVAAVLAENDRITAEAAHAALAHNRATRNPEGLIYRTQENARYASAAVYEHVSDGDNNYGANAFEEVDPYTMQLLEALGEVLGVTRIELSRERQAADAKLCDRINDLEHELKTLTASYQNAQARITELENQVTTLVATRVATLEKNTKLLVKALPGKSARISVVESQVKALSVAIASEPSARDLDSRVGYLEAILSTIVPTPARSWG